MFSAIVGFLVAAVIVAILAWTLDAEAMRSWGWRIPFLLAAPLGLIGLYIRLKLEDTPQFQELQAAGEVARAPLAEAFRHRRALLAVAGIAALHGSAFYAVLTFMITYIGTTVGLGATTGLVAAICGGVAALTLIPFVGGLSDRVGRRPILVTASVGFAVAVVPLFALVRTGTVGAIVGLVLLGFLLGTLVSTSIVAMTEVFPVRVRAAGSSLGYTVSLALFGGTAPFVATFLVSATGSTLSPAYYIVFTALLGLAGSLALPAASAADTTSH
jgi:MHS family proline/betaine transporter-like MFS transporter